MATDEGAFLFEFFRLNVVRQRCPAARAGRSEDAAARSLEHLVSGPADRRHYILGCGGEQRLMCLCPGPAL